MKTLIKKYSDTRISDVAVVGGKNASLGEMIAALSPQGINVPDGFATTAEAFEYFLNNNNIKEALQKIVSRLDKVNFSNLREIGCEARELIMHSTMPADLTVTVHEAYEALCSEGQLEVAVRSSGPQNRKR